MQGKEAKMAQAEQRLAAAFTESQIEVDGFRIRYWESSPSQPAGTVVMLAGMTWGLSRLRDALGQMYRVVMLELPGFGASSVHTSSQSVKGIAHTMALAAANLVSESYTLIGTSFAANVALWQTLLAPDKVEALVLISPTTILPATEAIMGSPESMIEQLFAHPEKARSLPSVDPVVLAKEQALVQRLGGGTHDAEAAHRLQEISCATLIIFGSEDQMVALEAPRVYRERIANSNLSFVYDAGHLIEAERPEALINAVSDYVALRETFIVGRQTGIINP
jgi:pimeloyl-ACP methyl ester carboxylesterase